MGKAINAYVNAKEEEAKEERYKLTYKEFEPYDLPVKIKQSNPHERVITEIREVTYLRDGYVKEENNTTRKIVLESFGTEIVKEVLVPRDSELVTQGYPARVVGSVTRDLRRKEMVVE